MAFYTATTSTSNFIISFSSHPRNDFGVFARGYLYAASKLAEDLLARPRFADYDAYPIVFLYRHALELSLKNVIYRSALLTAFKRFDDIDTSLYNNHRLTPLSEKAAAILRRLFPDDEILEHIVDSMLIIASEFSDIDPDSYAYRYPIDKQGNPSTNPDQVINLEALHRTMKELFENLAIIDFGLDVETAKAREVGKSWRKCECSWRNGVPRRRGGGPHCHGPGINEIPGGCGHRRQPWGRKGTKQVTAVSPRRCAVNAGSTRPIAACTGTA